MDNKGRDRYEDENDVEDRSGHEKAGVLLTRLGIEELILGLVHAASGLIPVILGLVN